MRDGYNISILPLEEADAPAIIVWNENQTKDFLEQWSGRGYVYPLTEAQIQARIVAQQSSDYRMYRIDRDGEMIGTISLLNIKPGEKKASIGHFLLNPGLTGKGLGTAALKEFVAMVFRETVFEKLTLTVFDFNKGAYRCYEKAGFIETDRSARPNGWVAVSMELEDLTFC
ncbi:MAG: GNAT family N-acetyltransferase [Firmicutes bacterium]|nr:GNAT family N-acetyltransferase [Bacillota bacterium]